jgi:hypothetical protein
VQSLEKWRESLKGTTWEEPIKASKEQSHGPTKEALEACLRTHPNPQEKGIKGSINKEKSHIVLMSVHAMRKAMTTKWVNHWEKPQTKFPLESNTWKVWSKVGEPFSDSGHVT